MHLGRRQRGFDPVAVGRSECGAWAAYYRRSWRGVLGGALGMVWHGFGLGPVTTLVAAWYVLRANQAWAPYPDNDPDGARRQMTRFYRLVSRSGRLVVDPGTAAGLEVAWWHQHRLRQHGDDQHGVDQHGDGEHGDGELLRALVDLYAYAYRAEPGAVRRAAELRVQAMHLSDTWVAAGCRLDDPTLAAERRALVASYRALADASERGALTHG